MSYNGLYRHQAVSVKKMKNGCILCGSVGAGKSLTALAYYYTRICDGKIPVDGKGDLVPPTNIVPLYIITTARKRDTRDWEKDGLYINLTGFSVDSWNNIAKYVDVKNAFFIFDEQRLVTPGGTWSKAFLKIAASNKWVVLSATPGDCWYDYETIFIAHGFYANKKDFERQHTIYNRYTQYPDKDRVYDEQKLIAYRAKILVDMDYKSPAVRHETNLFCEFNRSEYEKLVKTRKNILTGEPIETAGEFAMCARRISALSEDRINKLWSIIEQRKKVIVFYNYDFELDYIKASLDARNYPYAEYNGHKHQMLLDGGEWVYLVQYTSGKEGWNCTETNTICFYSLNYAYKTMEQAMGRIDRNNTPYKDLYYYGFTSYSPIDLAVRKAIVTKKNFSEGNYYKHIFGE